jgi:hypothetical protein
MPAREAVPLTARWLAEHRPSPGGMEERVLTDPFDYAAEDALIDAWLRARASVTAPTWTTEPGFGLAYSGPGGRPRSAPEFTP